MEQRINQARTADTGAGGVPEDGGVRRTIARRVGLPSGRAVVGALLIALAVVGLFTSYRSSQAETGTPYVVVADTVPAGAVIGPSDLTTRVLDLGEIADRTLTSPEAAVGSVAIQTLLPGQLLQEANIATPAAGVDAATYEVSFAAERERALDGRLVPGETVDVLATLDEDGESCTTVVAAGASIVRVGNSADDVLTNRSSFSVTLAVASPDDVLGVVFAADEAEITLVRATRVRTGDLAGAFCGTTAVEDAVAAETQTASAS